MMSTMDTLAFEDAIAEDYNALADRTDELGKLLLAELRDEHIAVFRRVRFLESRCPNQTHEEDDDA